MDNKDRRKRQKEPDALSKLGKKINHTQSTLCPLSLCFVALLVIDSYSYSVKLAWLSDAGNTGRCQLAPSLRPAVLS